MKAAYENGRPWFDELLGIIEGNFRYLRDRLKAELPEVKVADLEGTYLMWIDLSAYVNEAEAMQHLMEDECGIAVDYGAWFGGDEYDFAEIKKAVEADYKSKFKGKVKTIEFYIKPEDKAVYYVINGDFSDKIEL